MNDLYRILKGVLFGIVYACLCFLFFNIESDWVTNGLLSVAFLFLVPFVMGMITAYFNTGIDSGYGILKKMAPLYAVIGFIFSAFFLFKEGSICLIMVLPVLLAMAGFGGWIGVNVFYRDKNKFSFSLILLIPLALAPIESMIGVSDKYFEEKTAIEIRATDEIIWNLITRVDEIQEGENEYSLFQFMGFPRPLEAVLDTVSVGGVRIATFERGLYFTETVTEMEEKKILGFDIEVDPKSVPPKALDEHVVVGGKYFDVLHGKYELEKIGDKKYILHLESRFRLSTHMNFYAGIWSKYIMRDIQDNILHVIKNRAERAS